MKKPIYVLMILLAVLFLFVGCGSDPEPVEEPADSTEVTPEDKGEEPAPEAVPEVKPEEPEPEIDLTFLDDAEAALLRAGEVGAAEFYPDRFNTLALELEDARELAKTDPEAARTRSDEIIASANKLYDDSLTSVRDYYIARMDKIDEALLAMEADRYAPKTYAMTVMMRDDTEAKFEAGQYTEAQNAYRETMKTKEGLKDGLDNNIAWLNILIRDTEMYLNRAEEHEAYLWAEDKLEEADILLEKGRVLFADYNIKDAESSLLKAKALARKIAEGGSRMQQINKTDNLLKDVMKAIEEASNMTVVDEDGNIIDPDPWKGEDFLNENPLENLENDQEPLVEEESNLQDYTAPANGEAGVMGDEQNADPSYLKTAQKLWEKGVEARNAENLELANEYFNQAKIFVEAYESNAVSDFYTVTWREVNTDCLWRISSYDFIYDNPFLWPKIWRRNKKIIQNPDLIYPGQVLIIPPK
jgi:nucleoid-associated protein YgaU